MNWIHWGILAWVFTSVHVGMFTGRMIRVGRGPEL